MSEYDAGVCDTLGTGRLVFVEPEEIASDLLRKTGQENSAPVDLAPVLRRLGVGQVEDDLEGDGYLIRLPSGGYEMLVRRAGEANVNRQRFTIAHELGHFLSERLDATQDNQPKRIKVEDAPQKKVEDWCNAFASSLLMPAGAVLGVLGGPNGLLDPSKIENAAAEFQISVEAFCYRAVYLFKAALATTDAGVTRINRLSPKHLDTAEHRSIALVALQQQVREGRTSKRVIGGRVVRFSNKPSVVVGWLPGGT